MNEPKKILIVDDDLEFLQELSELMTACGYDVNTCSDGESALSIIPELMPDLILLDLKMSKINGFQVAERLRQMRKVCNIPVIAITGFYTQEEYSLMMRVCGVKKFIIKPIDPGKIVQDAEEVISSKSRNIGSALR